MSLICDALADVERCRGRRARSFDRRGRRIGERQVQRAHSHAARRVGLACRCCRRSSRLRGRLCSDGRSSRLRDRRGRVPRFAAGAFAASLRAGCFAVSEVFSAGCFAVSEVVLSAAGFSGVDFAFTTPEAADFAIAASAAGVSDGGSHVNSSRPSVGATAGLGAGAGLAAFAAGAFAGVSGSQVSSMISESALAAFLAAGGVCFGAACSRSGVGACFATGCSGSRLRRSRRRLGSNGLGLNGDRLGLHSDRLGAERGADSGK